MPKKQYNRNHPNHEQNTVILDPHKVVFYHPWVVKTIDHIYDTQRLRHCNNPVIPCHQWMVNQHHDKYAINFNACYHARQGRISLSHARHKD